MEEEKESKKPEIDWKNKVLTVTNVTGRILYTWTQTEDQIILEFYRAPKDEKKMTFELKSNVLILRYESVQGSDFEYSCGLQHEVDKDKYERKVLNKDHYQITLHKVKKGKIWLGLESGFNQLGEKKEGPQSYPTSSKGNRDWGNIDK